MENHSPYFLRISKRNGANHLIFQPEFQVSQVNDKHPSSFLLLFSYSLFLQEGKLSENGQRTLEKCFLQ